MPIDSVLMIGFGGPTPGCCQRREPCDCPLDRASGTGAEAECFVSGILGDNPARAARVREIAAHYRHLGGFSPYNQLTQDQATALQQELDQRQQQLRVYTAFRHWRPWPKDVLRQMAGDGCQETLLCIMSPHQCSVSWDWYIKFAAETALELGNDSPQFRGVLPPWSAEPGFIQALGSRLDEIRVDWDAQRWQQAGLIFTPHAIPEPLEQTSPYRSQVFETATLVAEALGHPEHRVAFQSQPDTPGMLWSAPRIEDVAAELAATGVQDIVVQAAGFLVDHVEVLYDLDHELRETCQRLEVRYHRAACVHDHPAFIGLLADRVEQALARSPHEDRREKS